MRRREFVAGLGSAAAWPLGAGAHESRKLLRIGFVSGSPRATVWEKSGYFGFQLGMRDLGYVEGKDFVIEWRFADGNYERFTDFAAEFARLKIDIIVAAVPLAIPPLRQANPDTPIVMAYSTDPVGHGFVASLTHPGGNTTGLASALDEITGKQIDLLQTVVPALARLGILGIPTNTAQQTVLKRAMSVAGQARITVLPINVVNPDDLENVFETASKEQVDAVIVPVDARLFDYAKRIATFAIAKRIPTMFANPEYVVAGGLMSYGDSFREFYRKAATFVDEIARGAKPGDLPVELPTNFRLVINRKTADALVDRI